MRDIKFRAWDKQYNQLSKVINLLSTGGVLTENGDALRSENTEIMQNVSGKKDKNGEEFYEGDILKLETEMEIKLDKPKLGVVIYYEEFSQFMPSVEHTNSEGFIGYDCDGFLYWEEAEIIGNIYENPDFLKSNIFD